VIGALSCKDVPISEKFQCWENDDLVISDGDRVYTYKAISLMPTSCCYFNEEEGWRECDSRCIFDFLINNVINNNVKSELESVLTPETVLVIISPFPLLPPHGITLVTDAPECLLQLLINASRAKEAESILNLKMPTLFLGMAVDLGDFIPDPLYFMLILPNQFALWLLRQQKLTVSSVPWYVVRLDYNVKRCADFFEKIAREEGGE